MEKAEGNLRKEQYDLRNYFETSYRLSQYYKNLEISAEEKHYLKEVLSKANEGSEREEFQKLKFFNEAKKRLLEIARGYNVKLEKLKLVSWVYCEPKSITSNRWS